MISTSDNKTEQTETAELQSFDELRVSEIRYRRLFEAAREGVLLLDSNTRKITDANPFMTELLGYTHEQFVGAELWQIGLLKDQEASRKMFQELRKKHHIRYENLPLKSTTGQVHEVEVVANLHEEGTRRVIQCNIRDITERKRAQHELLAAKGEITRNAHKLSQMVEERTVQLRETIGELEAFSYSISHDMRAPLRAMRGFSELLLANHAGGLDVEGRSYLEKINLAAARMDRLIHDVLTYTHVLGAEVVIEPIDLNVIVHEVIATYPQLHAKNVQIEIESVLPFVMGASTSLAQCISNLLSNAVKFVAPGTSPCVRIHAEIIEPDIRLWIEDNGVGIAAEDQTRIFKMFEQVDRASMYEGTGMGLTIVRKAVERMGGKMGVQSTVGRGSQFWIQLKGKNRE